MLFFQVTLFVAVTSMVFCKWNC